jgi:hypothetical protein
MDLISFSIDYTPLDCMYCHEFRWEINSTCHREKEYSGAQMESINTHRSLWKEILFLSSDGQAVN